MILPDASITVERLGREGEPLVIIDNFTGQPERLRAMGLAAHTCARPAISSGLTGASTKCGRNGARAAISASPLAAVNFQCRSIMISAAGPSARILGDGALQRQMGTAARAHVMAHHAMAGAAVRLDGLLHRVVA